EQAVWAIAFAPDGKSLAAGLTRCPGRERSAVALWDTTSGKRLHRLGSDNGASTLAFSADGKVLAADDNGITVWDTATGKQRTAIRLTSLRVYSLAFTPRGRSLLANTGDPPVVEWNVATGQEVRRFEGGPLPDLRMAVSPTGRYVAVGWRDGTYALPKN